MKRAVEDGKDDQAVATILTNAIGSEGERVTPGTAKRVEQVKLHTCICTCMCMCLGEKNVL